MTERDDLKFRAMCRLDNTRAHLLGLTMRDFTDRYGISYGQALDIVQRRSLPSLATRTLIEAIRLDPDLIARAAVAARDVYGRAIK